MIDLFDNNMEFIQKLKNNPLLVKSHTILWRLESGISKPFETYVLDGSTRIIAYLKEVFMNKDQYQGVLTTIVWADKPKDVWEQAAMEGCWEAARGIVQAITMEYGAVDIRLNLIRVAEDGHKELIETLEYLQSEQAAFVAGSSIDLKEDF
ncbi:hypothetical protein SAMN05444392_10683 [Seinonella peptonophila]|uniref:Uncharacterized protein n=1 Tax=Seinonella peptonophila TaxID=112248 RepID=A0A1M4Y7A8_9BACL|nr:hypothetical protein SAMN05444392_10683 [Seinonella peptonophila]